MTNEKERWIILLIHSIEFSTCFSIQTSKQKMDIINSFIYFIFNNLH